LYVGDEEQIKAMFLNFQGKENDFSAGRLEWFCSEKLDNLFSLHF